MRGPPAFSDHQCGWFTTLKMFAEACCARLPSLCSKPAVLLFTAATPCRFQWVIRQTCRVRNRQPPTQPRVRSIATMGRCPPWTCSDHSSECDLCHASRDNYVPRCGCPDSALAERPRCTSCRGSSTPETMRTHGQMPWRPDGILPAGWRVCQSGDVGVEPGWLVPGDGPVAGTRRRAPGVKQWRTDRFRCPGHG